MITQMIVKIAQKKKKEGKLKNINETDEKRKRKQTINFY